jgi:hypothetical protein
MNSLGRFSRFIALVAVFSFSVSVHAEFITLPEGTTIYGELDQTVTSKKKKFSEGDIVRARVWRNVVVRGNTVVSAGAPMMVRISRLKKAKVAGIKGDLELEAISTRTSDGTTVLLDGGYDKSGKGRKTLSITLGLLVAWPLIFIKGKQAELTPGTIFDATVQSDFEVYIEGKSIPKIKLGGNGATSVNVLLDAMDSEGKSNNLPIEIVHEGSTLSQVNVVTVNDEKIDPIFVELGRTNIDGDKRTVRGDINLKKLGKFFRKGINRFEVDVAGERVEVVMDVEL